MADVSAFDWAAIAGILAAVIALVATYLMIKDPKIVSLLTQECLKAEAKLKAMSCIDPAHQAIYDQAVHDVEAFKLAIADGQLTAPEVIAIGMDALDTYRMAMKMIPIVKCAPAPAEPAPAQPQVIGVIVPKV